MAIEELDGVYISTNKIQLLGKIVFEKDWSSDRSRYRISFVRFGPSSKEAIKRFIPAPLASSNKLTISLLTPQGQRLRGIMILVQLKIFQMKRIHPFLVVF